MDNLGSFAAQINHPDGLMSAKQLLFDLFL